MMLNSVVAVVENRNRDSDHLPLCQSEIAVTVHQAVVKGHEGPQSGRIQTVGLDDIIYTTPGAHRAFIDFGDEAGGFVFGNSLNPGHVWCQYSVNIDQ